MQVGEAIDPAKVGQVAARPYCLLYENEERSIRRMIIACGNGQNYIFNEPQQPSSVFFKLLAIYYVFDIDYSVGYALLSLIDEYCIVRKQLTTGPSKKKKKKTDHPLSIAKFIESFDSFKAFSAED